MDREAVKRLAEIARRRGFTRFLNAEETPVAQLAAREAGVECAFFGGFDGAERRVCAFFDFEPPEDYPVARLKISWNKKYASPGHRDILGAAMGLGLARETMGDIMVGEGWAVMFALTEIANYVADNLASAGRAKIDCEISDDCPLPLPKEILCRETVSAARLDSVIAAAFNLSRERAKESVLAGMAQLNHVNELRPDAKLGEGDLITLRGEGRARLKEIIGETKKGRIAITLAKTPK